MSKKVFNSDLETTGSVSCSSISTGSVTGTGVSVTGNISASLNVSANTATLNVVSSPLVGCTRIQPITGKTIEVSSSDSGESADTPLTLKISRPAQASCALELSEVNESTGAQAGFRLAYQGDGDEDLGISGDLGVNSSAVQVIRKADASSEMEIYNLLSSNSTASDVRIASEDTLAIAADTIELNGLVSSSDSRIRVRGLCGIEESQGSSVFATVPDNSIALGSVSKMASRGLIPGAPVEANGSQPSSYILLGEDQDTLDIRPESVFIFKGAGAEFDFINIVDTTYSYSGYTRGLVWLPSTTAGVGNNAGRVFVSANTTFTGVHQYLSADTLSVGDAVELIEGKISKTRSTRSHSVCGVVVGTATSLPGDKTSLGEILTAGQLVHTVASVGDSRHLECQGFNVCNENGDIQPGDLLVTSSTPGYLMKQDDDIIRSCTVGKAMEQVTFDENGQATGVYGYIYCG